LITGLVRQHFPGESDANIARYMRDKLGNALKQMNARKKAAAAAAARAADHQ